VKSRFHEAADEELTEAVAYYDTKASGLGDRFVADVKAATRYIEDYPHVAPVIEEGVRQKVLRQFPFSLMYVVEEHDLFIVAVAHQSRRPAYWIDRLPNRPV
jgi:plasmid stabilization system protein ParE